MRDIFKFFKYLKPYKVNLILHIVCNFIGSIFSLVSLVMIIPVLSVLFETNTLNPVSSSIDSISNIQDYAIFHINKVIAVYGKVSGLLALCFIIFGASFLKNIFLYMGIYIMAPLKYGTIKDIRNNVYEKVVNLPFSFFSSSRKGDIMSRTMSDVGEVEASIIEPIYIMFREPFNIILFLSYLIYMEPQLTLFVLLMLPVAGLIIGRIGKNLRTISKHGQQQIGLLVSNIEETITGLRIIKAFNAEKKVNNRFRKTNWLYTSTQTSIARRRHLASPMGEFLGTGVMVVIVYYGGSHILNSDISLTPEGFIGYIAIFSQLINPFKAISNVFTTLKKGSASLDRINELMNIQSEVIERKDTKNINKFESNIEYKNVSFRYTETDVLKNIDITINKGSSVAIVGESGSGKSTLVDLLPRFYDVKEGEILVDGINIKDLHLKQMRDLLGIVNQEAILFNDTIFNNITFGVEAATMEQVVEAAKIANAHDFIIETPDGYETNIGDRGNKLSGGQKQRISIARAVLKNPPVLILDEATSALDSESEKLVQDAITKLMKNRTSIVIAHRLSTIKHADEIIVLSEGRIVERGTHDELIKLNCAYKKYYELQMF